MNKFPRMCVGLGVLAAIAAAPALAGPPAGAGPASSAAEQSAPAGSESAARSTERVKRVGTRLEAIVVLAGAVDPQGRRWDDSGEAIGVLPTVSESAFLDDEGADFAAPPDSRKP